jgi:hypothetical protein
MKPEAFVMLWLNIGLLLAIFVLAWALAGCGPIMPRPPMELPFCGNIKPPPPDCPT